MREPRVKLLWLQSRKWTNFMCDLPQHCADLGPEQHIQTQGHHEAQGTGGTAPHTHRLHLQQWRQIHGRCLPGRLHTAVGPQQTHLCEWHLCLDLFCVHLNECTFVNCRCVYHRQCVYQQIHFCELHTCWFVSVKHTFVSWACVKFCVCLSAHTSVNCTFVCHCHCVCIKGHTFVSCTFFSLCFEYLNNTQPCKLHLRLP